MPMSGEEGRHLDDASVFLNGSNYAFPYGGASSISTEDSIVNTSDVSENDSPPLKDVCTMNSICTESFLKHRRTSMIDTPPSAKVERLLRCQHCSYSTDKKASLTKHARMHGDVRITRATEGPSLAMPPMARYCTNCDIQFASYKNYQVHKEYYCNTRHVHKSVASSPPITAQQQPTIPQSHSPGNQSSPSDNGPKPGYNMVLNQPLYAAISTSPLILVPCSYVAGGLSPSLIPAGNIVIPNPQASSPEPQKSVIPTFTVVPECAEEETKVYKMPKVEKASKIHKPDIIKSPHVGKEETEQPLDLSFRKKGDGETVQSIMDTGIVQPISSPNEDPPSLPMLNNDRVECTTPGSIPPVLVKQGANKCMDCNIVFYKHENYLVHRSKYCSNRLEADSLEKCKEEEDKNEINKTSQKSPISSPRINSNRTPPLLDSDPSELAVPPLPQYYCMACGIKYSSLDNLRAHQLYYCPKREIQSLALASPYTGLQSVTMRTPINQNYKCNKCKNAYPTEELLRQHPCVVQRKCPYCDVYCPTLSAAQRHLVTHTGIKSFRCSLCGYKGHTLRGMRTHIRIHLDKNSSTPEESYILCMDEGGTEIGCATRKTVSTARINSERMKSVISSEPSQGELSLPVSPISAPPPTTMPSDIQAVKSVSDDPVATGDSTHWCQICGYSSSYKGNVVRHVKLVHKDLVSSQLHTVNSKPALDGSLKQSESVEHSSSLDTPSIADHSNSSSSTDIKSAVNGLDHSLRVEEKLKTETTSQSGVTSKVLKRPLSDDTQYSQQGTSFTSKSGPKYCKSCDISFNYLSNFLAHKKFYCMPRQNEVLSQESTSMQPVQ